MPYKKQSKNQAIKIKKERLITKRLMEISFCVDNYIYKNRRIDYQKAQEYVNEIFSYKSQATDVRILQVIEKLTRCLKSVIQEITEEWNLNNNNNGQDKERYNNIDKNSFNIEQKSHDKVENDNNKLLDKNIKDVLITVNSSKSSSKKNPLSSKKKLRKQAKIIPSLANNKSLVKTQDTLRANVILQEMARSVIQPNCNNFFNAAKLNNDHETDILNSSFPAKENFINQHLVVDKTQLNNNLITFSESHTSTVPVIDRVFNLEKTKIDSNENKQIKNSSTIEDLKKTMDNITVQAEHSTGLTKNYNLLNESTLETPKEINNIKSKAANKIKQTIQEKPINTSKTRRNTAKKTITESKTRRKTKLKQPADKKIAKNVLSLKENTLARNKKNKIHKFKLNLINNEINIPATCNKNKSYNILPINQMTQISEELNSLKTANNSEKTDLSWIETIRYVREVDEDEFDSNTFVEDTFWGDFSLPDGWNDVDFLT